MNSVLVTGSNRGLGLEWVRQYGRLHEAAVGPADLEARLLAFHGVGPITVNIFLRELRPFWEKGLSS
jgi:NAD(P)-dependent dehydrogenase (short-subunit alcohol dehydrogenase family)